MSTSSYRAFNVHERLNELLKLHGNMSHYKLSTLSGIPAGTIRGWFKKKNYPPIDKLEAICHVFNISLADFFYEETCKDDQTISLEDHLLIKRWHNLSPRQRKLLNELMDEILEKDSEEAE